MGGQGTGVRRRPWYDMSAVEVRADKRRERIGGSF
jgi:hypothetical protein